VMMTNGNTATYKCCSVPQDGADSPFVVNSTAYLATIWTQFTLALIASLMACMLIVSIFRSLYLAKKKSPHDTTRRRNTGPDYSSYNLYLVLLALPTLVYNLFILGIVTDEYHNGWIPHTDALITICAILNQYMNAIIARELLTLLKRTKKCQRYVPPSLIKVSIQFGILAIYATGLGVFWLYLLNYSTSNSFQRAMRATVAIPMRKFTMIGYFVVVVIAPAIYLLWVCFEVWHKDLLPKSEFTIGQNLRFNTTSTDTPPTSQKSLKKLFFTFRKGANERYVPPTTATCTEDCRDYTFNTASSNRADSRPGSTNGAAATTSGNSNYEDTTTTARNAGGSLNILAMYFLHIIMVFFFLWLPGMVMYYIGYQTNQNASGLLHNLGLIFLSMQAIVSHGMALLKPDVRKSTSGLWKEVTSCCCKPKQTEDGYDNATTPTAPASSGKIPERWQEGEEGDIEVPIQGEPTDLPLDQVVGKPNKSPVSNVVTVHHEFTNIGGVQVSQLTTHTISSFNSSSHHDNGENGSDDENDEGFEFGFVPPPPPTEPPRNPSIPRFLILDGDSSLSRCEKDSKDEKKKKKKKSKKDKEKEPSDDRASGSSSGGRASLRKDLSTSPVSAKRNKKRLSGSHITDSPGGPPKIRNSRGGSKGSKSPSSQERMRKRLSGSHRHGSDSSSIGKHVGPSRRNSLTNSHRYGSDSSSIEKPARQPRRNSLTGLTGMPPVNKSPAAPSRKNRINSNHHDASDPPNEVPKRRNSKSDNQKDKSPKTRKKQLSGLHFNGSDSPAGQSKKTIGSNEKKGKSPVSQPKRIKSPVVKSKKSRKSKSPTAQRKKKLDDSGNYVSEPPLGHQNAEKIETNAGHERKSPTAQSKKKRDAGNGNESRVQKIVEQIESPRVNQRKGINESGSKSHGIDSSIPEQIELKFSDNQLKKSLNRSVNIVAASTGSIKKQMEKRISNTSTQVSASSDPSRTKKRISNSRGISYDGTVVEHCRSSISESVNDSMC